MGLLEREEFDKSNKLDPGQGYDDTGLVAKASGKKILVIHNKIQKEIEDNLIRAEGDRDMDAAENARQVDRFKELDQDHKSYDRYVTKRFDKTKEEPPQAAEYNQELVTKLMTDNVIIEENPNSLIQERQKKKKMEAKVEEILLRQLEQSLIKKRFERMTSLLGISNKQYLALQSFESFYKSRKNCGLEQMEKNQELGLGKELFACWDPERRGRIEIGDLAENLISFGLSMSRQ